MGKKLMNIVPLVMLLFAIVGCQSGIETGSMDHRNDMEQTGTQTGGSTESTKDITDVTDSPAGTSDDPTDTPNDPTDLSDVPAMPIQWIANCNEYINLRETGSSDGTVITRILAGETINLLGWHGKYARVSYGDLEGYVASNYIKPKADSYFESNLQVVKPTNIYSYEQMLADMRQLQQLYPNLIEKESIGNSEMGREIPALRLGNPDAQYHVLFQGSIHGREYATAWLLMALVDYWAGHNVESYGDICYHIIPMSNPDGVIISQSKTLTEDILEIYQRDKDLGYTTEGQGEYATRWKANALGVDINRNFPAGWDSVSHRESASSQLYKGEEPFSSAEAGALRDYTLQYSFDVTISYHAMGSLIYYEYGEKQPVNTDSYSLGNAVKEVTGYPLVGSGGMDGAGYKDWAMEALGIPSLTMEIGCQNAPLAEREIYSIFARNCRVFPAIAQWIQSR